MKIEDRIMEELRSQCRVTAELFIAEPEKPYFKGLHEQSIHTLRSISTIIEHHRED